MHLGLRRAIITGQLRPGDRLVEGRLAKQWGFSKSPTREALKALEHDGLVTVIPRRGYVVSPITIKAVRDLLNLRTVLERETAWLAASVCSAQDQSALMELVGHPYVRGDLGSYDRFLQENKTFHLAVARLAGNDRIVALLGHLLDELERLFRLGLDISDSAEAMIREHEELVTVIGAHDQERARQLMAEQIGRAQQILLDAILEGQLEVQVSSAGS
jgi:DNA-binding GntR family transcriptional regulator